MTNLFKCKKVSTCASCASYHYEIPLPITRDIENFITVFGSLKYPLDKVLLIRIENEFFSLDGRIGGLIIKVKYKKEDLKQAFEAQLDAYIGTMIPQV